MYKKIILCLLFLLFSISLYTVILYSYELTYADSNRLSPIAQFWQKTWTEKLSWCKLTGGQKIRTSPWYEKIPKYKCYHPYSDKGKLCHNSTDCKGECVIISPNMDFETYSHPSQDATLKEFNCSGLTSYETWKPSDPNKVYKTYRCEKNSFKAQCAAFDWDKYNQWTLNDNEINYLMAGVGL